MTSIIRFSFALNMFSLFLFSYLVASVSPQQGTNPNMNQANLSQYMTQDCLAMHLVEQQHMLNLMSHKEK